MHKNRSSENLQLKPILFKNGNENYITNVTPYDRSPLIKIKQIISNSPDTNLRSSLKESMEKFKEQNYICNEHQFKNIIRQLNIGLTNIEIDEIIRRSGRTYNGMISIKDFYKYVVAKEKNKFKIDNSISLILSEFKQLLYKYYSNPKLAFIFNDKEQTNKIDFNKFKGIIIGLYTKEKKPIPNYVVLKNCYEYIDLRKDGVIDLVEWCNIFSKISGKLDLFKGLENKKEFKELKKWEMSDGVIDIYKNIYKNRKIISLRAKNVCFGSVIQEDSLINILKENFPNYKLTNTQWKMIVEIGTKGSKGFINFEQFMNIVESYIRR
jgi:Ca2+-binding EF-hand superfamily protein